MATIRKRQKKSGIVYDIQVKVKDVGGERVITKTTTWTPEPKMSKTQQERAVAIFADQFEEQVRKAICESVTPFENVKITFREFGEQWLEKVKRDSSLNYYVRCKQVLEDANKFLGGYKIADLTPAIIQKYFDNLDSRTKITHIIKPKENFKQIVYSYGFTYKQLRYELNIQYATISYAFRGKQVSKEWADTFCKETKIPFDKLFSHKEIQEPYAYESIHKYKRVIRAMLSKAKKARLIEHNYASSDYIDFPKRPPRIIKCMDDEKAKKLFETLMDYKDIRIKTALLIFILTGFRRGEVAGLQWKDIDFEKETITVSRSLTIVQGYGTILKEPKTETSKRCVTVAKTLINVLKEYRKWWLRQTNLMGDLILDDTDWLFLQHNGKVLNPSTYMQWLREVLKVAGIEHYSLHSLRHTNITMQIAAGIPLVTVSARAGHARTSTTSDIYAHFIKSSDQTAAQIVDDVFNKKPN